MTGRQSGINRFAFEYPANRVFRGKLHIHKELFVPSIRVNLNRLPRLCLNENFSTIDFAFITLTRCR